MSSNKDPKKKTQETDNSQLTAHETLMEIISSLQKFSKMEVNFPSSVKEAQQKNEDSSEKPVQINCVFCKQPIVRSNFIISLQCCGAIAHIKCFAQMSADEQRITPHICPNCRIPFLADQVQLCQKLAKMVPS